MILFVLFFALHMHEAGSRLAQAQVEGVYTALECTCLRRPLRSGKVGPDQSGTIRSGPWSSCSLGGIKCQDIFFAL